MFRSYYHNGTAKTADIPLKQFLVSWISQKNTVAFDSRGIERLNVNYI